MRKNIVLGVLGFVLGIISIYFFIYEYFYYPPILMYHGLNRGIYEQIVVSSDDFRYQMEFLKRHNYNVISVEELINAIEKGEIPRKSVVITFDDGCKEVLDAIDILENYKYPATFFIPAGYLNKPEYLTEGELKRISEKSGVTIGVHGYYHEYLPETEDLSIPVVQAKDRLESIINKKAEFFAYPVGGFNRKIIKKIKEAGYKAAFTTNRGYSKEIDLYALRRVKVKSSDKGLRFWFKISGLYDFFAKLKNPE